MRNKKTAIKQELSSPLSLAQFHSITTIPHPKRCRREGEIVVSTQQFLSPAPSFSHIFSAPTMGLAQPDVNTCTKTIKALLLWLCCSYHCFSLFLFPLPLPVWCFLPFFKYVFPEVPSAWLMGSGVSYGGSIGARWNQVEPAVSDTGQPCHRHNTAVKAALVPGHPSCSCLLYI